MGMNPGLLRELLVLQTSTATKDAGGGRARTWKNALPKVEEWARVKPLPTALRMKAMQTDSLATHEVTIRHRTDVDVTKRWLWDATALVIVSDPVNEDERGEYVKMLCRSEAV